MKKKILVCTAWPYANNSLHLGHIAGAYLPADIFARYHRMKGNDVLMVSGSDAHGTPVTISAEEHGVSPEIIVEKYQSEFQQVWERFGISFDLFTSTHTKNHTDVVQDIFLKLYEKGFIYKDNMSQPYCDAHQRFLADRYLEGKCPHCGFEGARGDQCDGCSKPLDAKDLLEIRHRDCGTTPIFKETEHFFLKLSAFEDDLANWVNKQQHWKSNVKNFTIGFLKGGLQDRAITRDITWGVPIPLEGYQDKRIYVWFEAVTGYLSASIEWAATKASPDAWKEFWSNESRAYYFMGKDNIPFHTVIWPAMLLGNEELSLPFDVPANEYLNLEAQKMAKSKGWMIPALDVLARYDTDALRFTLSRVMPENADSDFTWEGFLRHNNDELVATYGNLVNRIISLTHRHFHGKVPQPGDLTPADIVILDKAESGLRAVENYLESCRFRAALDEAMGIAREANRYLEIKSPWRAIKTDSESAATTLWTGLAVLDCLAIVFEPFLPFSSDKLSRMLGKSKAPIERGWLWDRSNTCAGKKLGQSELLFKKLDNEIVEDEINLMWEPMKESVPRLKHPLSVTPKVGVEATNRLGLKIEAGQNNDIDDHETFSAVLTSAHAPSMIGKERLNIAAVDDEFRDRSICVLKDYIERCSSYPHIKQINMHFGLKRWIDESQKKGQIGDYGQHVDAIRIIAEHAESKGIEIVLENLNSYWTQNGISDETPYVDVDWTTKNEAFGMCPEEWIQMCLDVDRVNVKLCLDTSHVCTYAHRFPEDQREERISKFLDKPELIKHVHWSDNYLYDIRGRSDSHLSVGKGTIPTTFHQRIKQLDATILLEHFHGLEELEVELDHISDL